MTGAGRSTHHGVEVPVGVPRRVRPPRKVEVVDILAVAELPLGIEACKNATTLLLSAGLLLECTSTLSNLSKHVSVQDVVCHRFYVLVSGVPLFECGQLIRNPERRILATVCVRTQCSRAGAYINAPWPVRPPIHPPGPTCAVPVQDVVCHRFYVLVSGVPLFQRRPLIRNSEIYLLATVRVRIQCTRAGAYIALQHSPTRVRALIHSFIHALIHSFIVSLTHSSTHSFIRNSTNTQLTWIPEEETDRRRQRQRQGQSLTDRQTEREGCERERAREREKEEQTGKKTDDLTRRAN